MVGMCRRIIRPVCISHCECAHIGRGVGIALTLGCEKFGELLFEHDVCPLVNNIICVDKNSNLQRFMATTTPARVGVTGSVPLAGWDSAHDLSYQLPNNWWLGAIQRCVVYRQ